MEEKNLAFFTEGNPELSALIDDLELLFRGYLPENRVFTPTPVLVPRISDSECNTDQSFRWGHNSFERDYRRQEFISFTNRFFAKYGKFRHVHKSEDNRLSLWEQSCS